MILVVNIELRRRNDKNSGHCSLFLLVLLFLSACQQVADQRQMFVLSGPIMGTDYRITLIGESQSEADSVHEKVLEVMNSVNQSMSTYVGDSEVNHINRALAGEKINVSKDLAKVLAAAQFVSKLSEGAFDITVGPLIDLWGFGANGEISNQPTIAQLRQVSDFVGYEKLSINEQQLQKLRKETEINLSAIAKGYAVDLVARSLEEQGFVDYLINIGGELRAAGVNIDQQVWRVGIEKPNLLGGIQQVVKLPNVGIATSGDYLNYLIIDGQQYSHTIDPQTNRPVLHKLALVSVIHESAMMADALATAMMAMGETKAWDFAQEKQLAAYFTVRNEPENSVTSLYTPEFEEYLDD